jgi:hypothetical protein
MYEAMGSIPIPTEIFSVQEHTILNCIIKLVWVTGHHRAWIIEKILPSYTTLSTVAFSEP